MGGGWVRREKSMMGGHEFIYMSREKMDRLIKVFKGS
jgi:hypothetical protein